MNLKKHLRLWLLALVPILLAVFSTSAICQEINLDKMKKAGDLVCYQSLKEPAVWYYLPDQPRLAQKNGRPQFSFMKYSRTDKQGKAGTHAAQGGGVVHFLVTYGVTKDRVRAAERRLQEDYPEATIQGPIVYRKGSFALITSFTQDQDTLVRTVAVGKAPLMEGQKAAVSMALSREGAQLLWESFKSDTPDISLVFDMEFAGVREPYEATIEADWSRVSKHKRLKAGVKYSWFGADVDMLFQELRQDGAIKITTKGENASMDKIVESAHAKLLQVMFDPAPVDELNRAAAEKDSYSSLNQAMKMIKDSRLSSRSSLNLDSPDFRTMMASVLKTILSENILSSLLLPRAYAGDVGPTLPPLPGTGSVTPSGQGDQVESQQRGSETGSASPPQPGMTRGEQEARELFRQGEQHFNNKEYQQALDAFMESEEIHQVKVSRPTPGGAMPNNIANCHKHLGQYDEAADYYRRAAERYGRQTERGRLCLAEADRMEARASGIPSRGLAQNPDQTAPETAAQAYNRARRAAQEASESNYAPAQTRAAIEAYENYQITHPASGQREQEIQGRLRSLNRRLEAAGESTTPGTGALDMPIPPPVPTSPPGNTLSSTPSSGSGSSRAPGSSVGRTGSPTARPASSSAAASTPRAASGSSGSGQRAAAPSSGRAQQASNQKPGFSLVASYKMKNIKRSGKMVYQMNHFRSEKQSFTMAENIGSLYSRYQNDARIFKAITIDDPVFKQREILVTLDGQDAATFTKYLNFVTVKMKKRHQSGENTMDEVVITPETFSQKANAFSLSYGYKGDTNRDLWLGYEYQVIWSFHGGVDIRSPWKKETNPMLSLFPPHQYKGLTIEGEGEALRLAKVRHALVTVSSRINNKPIATQATIKNLELKDQRLEGDILYWDELPQGGNS
ncbi:MAG: tetratricopeptide repeat protein [Desulfobacter sp.]|nr:MAG: tetratricopeptide repeat protein [Desulfobacter sp.]